MAVGNNLNQKSNNKVTTYETDTGTIQLDYNTIRNYLVNGNATITDQECLMFIGLCKGQKLNPFMREAYLIKYSNSTPASMVVSKDVFQKRADKNADYDGKKAGIIVETKDGEIVYRDGTFYKKDNETIVGGWCEVFKKSRKYSERIEVSMDEYIGTKSDGTVNSQWAKKPATMIRKVAVVQALREAFTSDFQGMYTAEEFGASDADLPIQEVIVTEKEVDGHQELNPNGDDSLV